MKRKMNVFIVTLLMVLTTVVIVPDDLSVEASSEESMVLDYDFIYNTTKDLSDVIRDAYNVTDLRKGRYFGSKGEYYAATQIIKPKMEQIGLWSPEELDDPYLEPIENIWYPSKYFIYGGVNLNEDIDVLDIGITAYNQTSQSNTYITECYISPAWNESLFNLSYDRSKLTYNFSYTNLTVRPTPASKFFYGPGNTSWFDDFICDIDISDIIKSIDSIYDLASLMNIARSLFENYYGFEFDELNPNDPLTWPDNFQQYYDNVSEDYVMIEQDNSFNPDKDDINPKWEPIWNKNITILGIFDPLIDAFWQWLWHILNPKCKGLILYDFNNETYNMPGGNLPFPILGINGSIGKPIHQDYENHNITYYINQSHNDQVVSYNVIGQINGTDPSKTVIISSLYDSWWCQGTSDSAIGMSIVLAIAKKMKELEAIGIIPKYNVKFIGFGGEEKSMRGAWYYHRKHRLDDPVVTVIDLNQLGFNKTSLGFSSTEQPFTLELFANKFLVKPFLENIFETTDYQNRIDNDSKTETSWSWRGGRIGNQMPFASFRPFCKTIYLVKMGPWKYHHRDGQDHEEGDVITYYDDRDVNLSAELAWNISKFFTINPDCWFDGEPVYTLYDSDDDDNNYYDALNVTFSLDTSMPKEPVSVRLVLHPMYKDDAPAYYPLLYRQRDRKEYIVTPDGVNGYINVSLPKHFPLARYVAKLYLCNSSGNTILDTTQSISIPLTALEFIDHILQAIGINILEKLIDNITEILNYIGLDIFEWLERIPDIRPIRKLLVDILGYYVFSDAHSKYTDFLMAPLNDAPNKPDKPEFIEIGDLGAYWYKTKGTDPNSGDKLQFQWDWGKSWTLFSFETYDQNQYHENYKFWTSGGEKKIKVRSRNPWSANMFSPWSDKQEVNIDPGGYFNVATSQAGLFNINVNPLAGSCVENSFKQDVVVVNQPATYQGFSYGLTGSSSYEYDFNDETTVALQNTEYTFDTTGAKYVNLTVDSSSSTVSYNTTIDVVNISACFTMTQLGGIPGQTIGFKDKTLSNLKIVNWTWNLGDGNNSYTQNVSHNYSQIGAYNVSLNATDSNNETATFWQIIHIESNPPEIIALPHFPASGILGNNITLYGGFSENESGINTVNINISCPNGTTNNFTMNCNNHNPYGSELVFNDTMQVGWYFNTIWVKDYANNSNYFSGYGFQVLPAFGYSRIGKHCKNIKDNISGSNFTILVNGTAESVSAYIHANLTSPPKTKCMIYRVNDSQLIATTEEKTLNTGDEPDWVTYNFTGSKPNLTTDTQYILACWSNDTCNLSYDNTSDDSHARYKNYTYGSPPSPIVWDANESSLYSIYCTYSTVPEILNVSISPDTIGFGYNTTISAEVEHYYTLVDSIMVNITYPNSTTGNFSMSRVDDDNFQYTFSDTWAVGQYNYSVWVLDELGGNCSSSVYSFNVSAQADMSVCTIKDTYTGNETVNLTDPPGPPSEQIGYELLDDDKVLHIWNKYDSYYFNTSNGVQFTNHMNEYWSHNVLMLGYYNNDVWNLIYRTDNLSGFNKNIESDDETYVNATLWKNLSYEGYDFRLAVRYHLGVDDNELTVIPFIKNTDDEDIPYVLGFAWEINDIQVDMTPENDYIEIDDTWYYLNGTIDETYTNLSQPCYYIREDKSGNAFESLYLRWNNSLNYKVKVESRDEQYNAPVTLGIRIGTLDVGQEKYTSLFWHDASEIVYYFNGYDTGEAWSSNPGYMVDGNTSNYASTTLNDDVEFCDNNTCPGTDLGIISKVELRVYGYYSGPQGMGSQYDIILRPVFNGTNDGLNHSTRITSSPGWSYWVDITNDHPGPGQPSVWVWSDVDTLGCDVEAEIEGGTCTLYCSKIEVRVTYNQLPVISNPYPADGSTGIPLTPMLNITVSDGEGDLMNITWYSNSSDSWVAFGSNNSVGNGTYHQTFVNASVNGQWWYWKVNVSDGTINVESSVYKFYTGNQSKIENNGSTDIKGYLLMQVQFYNGSAWIVADDTVNETTTRMVNSSEQLGLDTIFNGLVNTSDLLSSFGSGSYRVYACFRDPNGDVLVCDDQSLMEASYEFTVSDS